MDTIDTNKKVITQAALDAFAKRIPIMGNPNNTAGENAIAFGANAHAAANSFAFNGTATGEESIAIGAGTQATKPHSVQIGSFPVIDDDADFILGNGLSESDRKNLMMIKNGILFLPWSDAQGDDLKLYTWNNDASALEQNSEGAIFESTIWFDRLPYPYVKYVFETVEGYGRSENADRETLSVEINIFPRTIPEIEFTEISGTYWKNDRDNPVSVIFKWSLTAITGLEKEGYLLKIFPNIEYYGDTTAERFYTKWKLISKQISGIQPF